MPLLNEDVERIEKLGFRRDSFVVDKDGWLQLRNESGKCVFNNGERCLIYENRPKGCVSYPLVFDEEKNRAAVDYDCPRRDEFRISKEDRRMLTDLVRQLKDERRGRE